MEFKNPFGRRANLVIKHKNEELKMFQDRRLLFHLNDNDLPPYEMITRYCNDVLSPDKADRVFEIFKESNRKLMTDDMKVSKFDHELLFELWDIFDYGDIRNWLRRMITIPPSYENMNKAEFGKDSVITHDGEEYLNLVALVVHANMASPIIALLTIQLRDVLESIKVWTILERYYRDLPAIIKYHSHIDKTIGNSRKKTKAVEMEVTEDEVVDSFALSGLFGRLATHNFLNDNDNINLPKRVHYSIGGRSSSSFHQRSNVIGDKAVSSFDLQTPYDLPGNIAVEFNVLTNDEDIFLGQIYQDRDKDDRVILPPRKRELFEMARRYMGDIPPKEVTVIMSICLKEFITPEAISLLEPPTPGILNSINLCRATAFMETYDEFPELALTFISSIVQGTELEIGDNISKSKNREVDMKGFTVCGDKVIEMINILTSITRYDFHVIVPGAPEVNLGLNIRKILLDYININN